MDTSPLLHGIKSRWLVTGAAGFIGSHLAESLALAGQHVTAIDNFATGKRSNVDAIQAATSAGAGVLDFIEGDICDRAFAGKVAAGVDYVLHQAALGSVPRSLERPLASFDANCSGFMSILSAARDAGVKSFVYASSSSVYGDHPALPKVEEQTGAVLSPYAATKAADELFANVFARCYGIKTVGLRYFNVFGARQDPEGAYAAVIPKWIASLVAGEPVFINGDGESSRDFCFIDNVVQANIRAALANRDQDATVLNIAVGHRTTLNQLYELLKDVLAGHVPAIADAVPTFRDFRPGDVKHSLADITRARREIGYQPTHSLDQGLRLAVGWYLANLARGR